MRVRKRIQVECSSCKEIYLKREDTLVNWNGMCWRCSNRNTVMTKIKGVVRVKIKTCFDCGRESKYIGKSDRCFRCGIPLRSGQHHYKWKSDRNQLAKRQERNDTAYKEWRKMVWIRDNFRCKIEETNCLGRIEAHHILSWSEYPELRYKINNGITLCRAHHPRKRSEEKRLVTFFQELVSVSSVK